MKKNKQFFSNKSETRNSKKKLIVLEKKERCSHGKDPFWCIFCRYYEIGLKKRVKDKNILNEIKGLLDPKSYVECITCGAIKVDAMELARSCHILCEKYLEKDDEKSEVFDEMLGGIIEYEPDFEESVDYVKWFEKNDSRFCVFLDPNNYGSKMYIKYSEVLLFSNKQCECLKVL